MNRRELFKWALVPLVPQQHERPQVTNVTICIDGRAIAEMVMPFVPRALMDVGLTPIE